MGSGVSATQPNDLICDTCGYDVLHIKRDPTAPNYSDVLCAKCIESAKNATCYSSQYDSLRLTCVEDPYDASPQPRIYKTNVIIRNRFAKYIEPEILEGKKSCFFCGSNKSTDKYYLNKSNGWVVCKQCECNLDIMRVIDPMKNISSRFNSNCAKCEESLNDAKRIYYITNEGEQQCMCEQCSYNFVSQKDRDNHNDRADTKYFSQKYDPCNTLLTFAPCIVDERCITYYKHTCDFCGNVDKKTCKTILCQNSQSMGWIMCGTCSIKARR